MAYRKQLEKEHAKVKLPRNLTQEERSALFDSDFLNPWELRDDDSKWYVCFNEDGEVEATASPDFFSDVFSL